MIYFYAFLIGGLICLIGELLIEFFHLTPGHITCLFVIVGAFLEFFDIYDRLVDFAGAGALLPITSFGHSLAHAAYEGALNTGFLGLSQNLFQTTSNGIVYAIVCAVGLSLIFKPKG